MESFLLDDWILIEDPHRARAKVDKVVVKAVFWRKRRLGVVKGLHQEGKYFPLFSWVPGTCFLISVASNHTMQTG